MRINGRWFDVVMSRGSPTGRSGRLGIAVSKKRVKRAVDRNKIKRQVRAVTRESAVGLTSGWNIKVIVKSSSRNFGDIKSDLSAMFQTARKRI